jgi:hypothetical protein
MAIYQDIQGDKAGGRLPYMQAPVGGVVDNTPQLKLKAAKAMGAAGLRLAGIAMDTARRKEISTEKRLKEQYEKDQAQKHIELERRVHFNRGNSHIVAGHIAKAKNRLLNLYEGLDGKDASEKWRQAVLAEANKFNFREPSEVPEELTGLIDSNVVPSPEASLQIKKGHLTKEDAVRGDQLRALNSIYGELVKWGESQEGKLLIKEVEAAQHEKRQKLRDMSADLLESGIEETSNFSGKAERVLIASEELQGEVATLYQDDEEAFTLETLKTMSQVGGAFLGVGDSLKLNVGGISEEDLPSNWRTTNIPNISARIAGNLGEINAKIEVMDDYYKHLSRDYNRPEIYTQWQDQREQIEKGIANDLKGGIEVLSNQRPRAKMESWEGYSGESFNPQKDVGSFGSVLVQDDGFIGAINQYLPKAEASSFFGNYGFQQGVPNGTKEPNLAENNTNLMGEGEGGDPIPDPVKEQTLQEQIQTPEGMPSEPEAEAPPPEPESTTPAVLPSKIPVATAPLWKAPEETSGFKVQNLEELTADENLNPQGGFMQEFKRNQDFSISWPNYKRRRHFRALNVLQHWSSHPSFPYEITKWPDIVRGESGKHGKVKFINKPDGKKGEMDIEDCLIWWNQPYMPWSVPNFEFVYEAQDWRPDRTTDRIF